MAALVSILEEIRRTFVSDVQLIRDFVEDTQASLKRREKRKPKVPRFNEEDRAEFVRLVEFLGETIQEMKAGGAGQRSIQIKSKAVGQLFTDILKMKIFSPKYAQFLAEMV